MKAYAIINQIIIYDMCSLIINGMSLPIDRNE